MRWNPFLNAIYASAYIWAVALLFQYLRSVNGNMPDNTILDPIAALSLLVFSVAFMGFIFFYRPVVLLLDNKREEAISYFLKTLGTFGALTVIAFIFVSTV